MEKEKSKAGENQPSSTLATSDQPQQSSEKSAQLPQHDANIESSARKTDATPQLQASTAQQLKIDDTSSASRHQVIAVSASKGPAAFFNLARKFLATDEFCDLSALEGAIVSAVDAAHLLERSKLADIVRIQTSYVPVEPKRKSQETKPTNELPTETTTPYAIQHNEHTTTMLSQKPQHQGRKGGPLRRSRIIITVQRTEDYRKWLLENPHQAATGHGEDIE